MPRTQTQYNSTGEYETSDDNNEKTKKSKKRGDPQAHRSRPSNAELTARAMIRTGVLDKLVGTSASGAPTLFSPNRSSFAFGNSELTPNRVPVGGQPAESPKTGRNR